MKKGFKVVAAFTLLCFMTTQCVSAFPGATIEMAGGRELPFYQSMDIPEELGTVDALYEAPAGANPQFILHIQNAHANYEAQMKIKELLGYMNKQYGFKTIFVEGASEKLDADYLRLFPDQERNLKLCDELAKQGELTGAELFLMEQSTDGGRRMADGEKGQDGGRRKADGAQPGLPPSTIHHPIFLAQSATPSPIRPPISPAQGAVEALGIEESSLYKANYDALKKVFGAESDVTRFFKGFDGKLDKAASRTFDPETRELIADWKRFEQGRREFMPFVKSLAVKSRKILKVDLESLFAQVGWPQITRLLVIQMMEKDLNKAKGIEEQAALLKMLRAKGVSQELLTTLENFKEGSITVGKSATEVSPREVLERLASEAGPQGFKFSDYPAFSLYAGYVTLRSELDPKALFEEIEYLFTQMLDTLTREPEQKVLLALYRDGELLRKLLHLELNRAQWRQVLEAKDRIAVPSLVARLKDAVQTTDGGRRRAEGDKGQDSGKRKAKGVKAGFAPSTIHHPISSAPSAAALGDVMPPKFAKTMDELFTASLEFYDFAHKREAVFYQEMQAAMTERKINKAILITGGFHTDGMSDLFRENAVSYGIVTPRLSEKSDENLYRKIMLRKGAGTFETSYMEAILSMEKPEVNFDLGGNGDVTSIINLYMRYSGLTDLADVKRELMATAATIVAAGGKSLLIGADGMAQYDIRAEGNQYKLVRLPAAAEQSLTIGGALAVKTGPITLKAPAAAPTRAGVQVEPQSMAGEIRKLFQEIRSRLAVWLNFSDKTVPRVDLRSVLASFAGAGESGLSFARSEMRVDQPSINVGPQQGMQLALDLRDRDETQRKKLTEKIRRLKEEALPTAYNERAGIEGRIDGGARGWKVDKEVTDNSKLIERLKGELAAAEAKLAQLPLARSEVRELTSAKLVEAARKARGSDISLESALGREYSAPSFYPVYGALNGTDYTLLTISEKPKTQPQIMSAKNLDAALASKGAKIGYRQVGPQISHKDFYFYLPVDVDLPDFVREDFTQRKLRFRNSPDMAVGIFFIGDEINSLSFSTEIAAEAYKKGLIQGAVRPESKTRKSVDYAVADTIADAALRHLLKLELDGVENVSLDGQAQPIPVSDMMRRVVTGQAMLTNAAQNIFMTRTEKTEATAVAKLVDVEEKASEIVVKAIGKPGEIEPATIRAFHNGSKSDEENRRLRGTFFSNLSFRVEGPTANGWVLIRFNPRISSIVSNGISYRGDRETAYQIITAAQQKIGEALTAAAARPTRSEARIAEGGPSRGERKSKRVQKEWLRAQQLLARINVTRETNGYPPSKLKFSMANYAHYSDMEESHVVGSGKMSAVSPDEVEEMFEDASFISFELPPQAVVKFYKDPATALVSLKNSFWKTMLQHAEHALGKWGVDASSESRAAMHRAYRTFSDGVSMEKEMGVQLDAKTVSIRGGSAVETMSREEFFSIIELSEDQKQELEKNRILWLEPNENHYNERMVIYYPSDPTFFEVVDRILRDYANFLKEKGLNEESSKDLICNSLFTVVFLAQRDITQAHMIADKLVSFLGQADATNLPEHLRLVHVGGSFHYNSLRSFLERTGVFSQGGLFSFDKVFEDERAQTPHGPMIIADKGIEVLNHITVVGGETQIDPDYFVSLFGELAKSPDFDQFVSEALDRQAYQHDRKGDAVFSLRDLENAAHLDPDNILRLVSLGRRYANLSRLDDAEDAIHAALRAANKTRKLHLFVDTLTVVEAFYEQFYPNAVPSIRRYEQKNGINVGDAESIENFLSYLRNIKAVKGGATGVVPQASVARSEARAVLPGVMDAAGIKNEAERLSKEVAKYPDIAGRIVIRQGEDPTQLVIATLGMGEMVVSSLVGIRIEGDHFVIDHLNSKSGETQTDTVPLVLPFKVPSDRPQITLDEYRAMVSISETIPEAQIRTLKETSFAALRQMGITEFENLSPQMVVSVAVTYGIVSNQRGDFEAIAPLLMQMATLIDAKGLAGIVKALRQAVPAGTKIPITLEDGNAVMILKNLDDPEALLAAIKFNILRHPNVKQHVFVRDTGAKAAVATALKDIKQWLTAVDHKAVVRIHPASKAGAKAQESEVIAFLQSIRGHYVVTGTERALDGLTFSSESKIQVTDDVWSEKNNRPIVMDITSRAAQVSAETLKSQFRDFGLVSGRNGLMIDESSIQALQNLQVLYEAFQTILAAA